MGKNQDQNSELQGDNPYAAPVHAEPSWVHSVPQTSTFVRQVKPLCVCMIILGVMEILMGLFWIGLAIFVPMFVVNQQGRGPQIPAGQQEMIQTVIGLSYGGIGLVVSLVGAFRIYCGWRGLHFRSRRAGLISHFVGMLSFLTCYCLPTSIGICVWGCIVYFKPEVKNAFRLGEDGHSAAEIEAGVAMPPAKP